MNLIRLEEVTGWRVAERREPRAGEGSHESEREVGGREALREALRRSERRLRGPEGCMGRDWELLPSSAPGEEGGA